MGIEQEFKWDGAPRGAFGHFVQTLEEICGNISSGGTVQITDYYLDNAAGQLAARKVALRIRYSNAKWEATCKRRSQIKNGLARRQERTLALPQARSIKSALKTLQQRQDWVGLKKETLQVRFIIRNCRQLFYIRYKSCACEAALDNYVTCCGKNRLRRKEIELELKKGSTRDFKKLIEKIATVSDLKPVKISKVAGAEKWILQKFSLN
ncbi:MAG: CYTH domain-containing protein [Elusimicrobiaceae bacterium]|nr:CYTH domain-containing protein [Elusimicrobiaceae bacterium]